MPFADDTAWSVGRQGDMNTIRLLDEPFRLGGTSWVICGVYAVKNKLRISFSLHLAMTTQSTRISAYIPDRNGIYMMLT